MGFHLHRLPATLAFTFIFLFLKITPTSPAEDKPSSYGDGSHTGFRAETHLRHRQASHTKGNPASSKGVSYLDESEWANIESVESVKPYPGEAETYPGEAETESLNEKSSPQKHYNENAP